MAITAKVNMVLHGDGSAHIFKEDAFKSLSDFRDSLFRPAAGASRSVPKSKYAVDTCESFDVVVSNPPFGIKLAADTKAKLTKNFTLKKSSPSEALFLERCYQLLKPGGRLGLVVPESLVNTVDSLETRLLLYRCFWLRAVVALPRNAFIDTPTLTSLLFAQKKTADELKVWDDAWAKFQAEAETKLKRASAFLLAESKKGGGTAAKIQAEFLSRVQPVVPADCWLPKKGKNAAVMSAELPSSATTKQKAIDYYLAFLKLAGMRRLVAQFTFEKCAAGADYSYPVFRVEGLGYKLSKRKEKIQPNQLCKFVGANSGVEHPNLHLADEELKLEVELAKPERVLDFIKRDIKWS